MLSMFRFASAVSEHPSIYKAIGECVVGVRAQLGGSRPPSFVLLAIKGYGDTGGIGHAPAVSRLGIASRGVQQMARGIAFPRRSLGCLGGGGGSCYETSIAT